MCYRPEMMLGPSKTRYERTERKEPRSESPRHIKWIGEG